MKLKYKQIKFERIKVKDEAKTVYYVCYDSYQKTLGFVEFYDYRQEYLTWRPYQPSKEWRFQTKDASKNFNHVQLQGIADFLKQLNEISVSIPI